MFLYDPRRLAESSRFAAQSFDTAGFIRENFIVENCLFKLFPSIQFIHPLCLDMEELLETGGLHIPLVPLQATNGMRCDVLNLSLIVNHLVFRGTSLTSRPNYEQGPTRSSPFEALTS